MEQIAIVGLDCIFPGADGLRAFWDLLVHGRDAIDLVPKSRWDREAWFDSDPTVPAKIASKWGGFVAGLEDFDAAFFGLPPQEAETMDPQHKLLLEVTYRALENAGLPVKALAGSQTGVFVGIGHSDHEHKFKRDLQRIDANLGVHTYRCFAANRISYHLNLQGPSMAIDTACSSSLAAVHLACQSLHCGESDLAIAAGVNAHLAPEESVSSTKMGLLSADGRCRSFAADAAGHARSEGCGVLVLKRLGDAIQQGDKIWGVIRGSALNHNGASNGITAPNGPAQVRVIRRAWSMAQVSAAQIDYVEAHATGTVMGDRVELSALEELFAERNREPRGNGHEQNHGTRGPCWVGSVKSNLGHLEAAAGVASLIKAVLALEHQLLPRSLYSERPHPDLPFGGALQPLVRNEPWLRRPGEPRRAGISGFGFGGANAHLVVEEAPVPVRARIEAAVPGAELLLLSAKTEAGLQRLQTDTASFLREPNGPALADVCFSFRHGRTPLTQRCALVARDKAELIESLSRAGSPALTGKGASSTSPACSRAEPPASTRIVTGRAGRVVRVGLVSGPGQQVASSTVASLRAVWPKLSARALAGAEAYAAQVADAGQRSRLLAECFLIELLSAWGVTPTWFLARDEVGGWAAAYARHRVGVALSEQSRAAALPLSVGSVGLHDFKSGVVHALDPRGGANEALAAAKGVTFVALSGSTPEEPWTAGSLLHPFAAVEAGGSAREQNDAALWPRLLESLGSLWVAGLNIAWSAFDEEQGRARVPVPTYPFEKQPSWFEPRRGAENLP